MDPSKPPHSHPGSGGSTGNNPPELPPHDDGGSTTKRKMTTSEEDEDEDVDITGLSSTPTESSNQEETEEEDTTTTTTIDILPWRREEINLLKGILDFYHKKERYPYAEIGDMQDFFKNWVQERGFFRDEIELNVELDKLNTRFLMNMEKKSNSEDIKATMDATEIEIFRLSNRVWGKENDHNHYDDDHDHENTNHHDHDDDDDQENTDHHDHGGDEVAALNVSGNLLRKEEINLLNEVLDFYKKNGRYPCNDSKDLQEFYKKWIERGIRVYRNEVDLKKKIKDLQARFLKNLEKIRNGEVLEDIEEWMDPIDVEIYRLSYRVWMKEDDIGIDDGGKD